MACLSLEYLSHDYWDGSQLGNTFMGLQKSRSTLDIPASRSARVIPITVPGVVLRPGLHPKRSDDGAVSGI